MRHQLRSSRLIALGSNLQTIGRDTMRATSGALGLAVILGNVATAAAERVCTPIAIPPLETSAPGELSASVYVNAINNWGQVVGRSSYWDEQDALYILPFLWHDGRLRQLPTLAPGRHAEAAGINDLGWIVGGAEDERSQWRPAIWTRRGIAVLADDGWGHAVDINNRGEIIGQTTAGCAYWRDESSEPRTLGGFGGDFCQLRAINDRGTIVGMASFPDRSAHGAVWDQGVLTDIHTTPGGEELVYSELWDINDQGVAVGVAQDTQNQYTAIVWSAEDGVQRLPGVASSVVNRRGVITGTAAEDGYQLSLRTRSGRTVALGRIPMARLGDLIANDRFEFAFGTWAGDVEAFYCRLD